MAREGFRRLLCSLVAFLMCCVLSISESDVSYLLEFRKGIRVDPLGKVLSSWDPSRAPNPCSGSWEGVSCDETGGHVVGIALDGLGLAGELKFHTLTGLYMLRNLTLSGNNFTGRIEPTFGSMGSLQYLDLSHNSFYGSIPGKFNDLYSLNYLNMSMNGFSGGYPDGLSNLQQLKVFDLRGNNLYGDVGVLFQQLRNVEHVDLSSNRFYGNVNIGFLNASSLANTAKYLNLSHNNLNGGFFDGGTLQIFRNLEVLDLGNNSIGGQLPSFNSLPNLKVLKLGNNLLFGSMPEELFETISQLVELDLSSNGFTGSIPIVNSTTLKILNLSSNQISGTLPSTMKSCTTVDLSRNRIKDDISTMETWEAPLDYLDLSSNELSGSIPNLTSQYQSLTILNLSNNSLAGSLPYLTVGYQKLSMVDLSSNELQGTIPAGFFLSTLTFLNLSGNQLMGPIPVQSGHVSELLVMPTSMQMRSLDLSGNSLSGPLPGTISEMSGLQLLNLAGNKLSGQIPAELGKLSNLEYLDLSGNDFSGRIPDNMPDSLTVFNVSRNNLEGPVPKNLERFPPSSFKPGNGKLVLSTADNPHSDVGGHGSPPGSKSHGSKGGIAAAIVVASVVAIAMIVFAFFVYHRSRQKDFHGSSSDRDIKLGRFSGPSLFNFHSNEPPPQTSLSFSNDHLLTSNSRSLSGQPEFTSEIEHIAPVVVPTATSLVKSDSHEINLETSGRKSSPDSPPLSSPRFAEGYERPVRLDVESPDRLAGELTFLDSSLSFTAEELSRAPAEVLGRSSHGTLYKATLDSGHMLTVKWLRVGLVRHKKDFAKELKKIGSLGHPNIVPLRAYYWGPREQERLLLADYIQGDSLALHLYETTPRRHPLLSLNQRLNVAMDVAQGLSFLHEKGICHGNLKPSNILLNSPNCSALLTDYSLHRLMTPAGIAEQILNLGALGYRAPELEDTAKPVPTTRTDVYSFGVVLMELLTRRSAGDIVFGESGVVNLTSWVRLCHQEGRGMDCIDRDIVEGGEAHPGAMEEVLAVSLRCILPANERPSIRQVLADLSSLTP
ncbi:hypothetical protein MLD38_019503 [Melastoma candidum]|uniref:Uncharacterized protein n=1 Tax=Melastoma candidum TaxID=119954 RepID=A0ACB9R0A3_9MYRT|nr:hypothetical protein MLD38_019503 [Melastoma candidum]